MSRLVSTPWPELLILLQADLGIRKARPEESSEETWREARTRIRLYTERVLSERHALHTEDVDDVVQIMLLKLQSPKTLERLMAARFPLGYLIVMIRNAANDLARRRTVELESAASLEQAISGLEEIHGPLEKQQARDWLAREVRLLRDNERALLYMRFWQGLQISEIAERLGVPYSRVAVRLFRLLRKLGSRSGAVGPGSRGKGARSH